MVKDSTICPPEVGAGILDRCTEGETVKYGSLWRFRSVSVMSARADVRMSMPPGTSAVPVVVVCIARNFKAFAKLGRLWRLLRSSFSVLD